MFSFIYRHDDEINMRLDESIRAKKKVSGCNSALESLCQQTAELRYLATVLTGGTKECRCNENHVSLHRVYILFPFWVKFMYQSSGT
jgi:hypothetical protein